jgi:hypothetical protein
VAAGLVPAAWPAHVSVPVPLVRSVWRLGALVAGGIAATPEPAVRDAVGWLLGGLAASVAPYARPGVATAVLVWASSRIRPRAAPMTAPSRAPTTTRTWPRRGSAVSRRRRRPDRQGTHQPESRQGGIPATARAGRQPCGWPSIPTSDGRSRSMPDLWPRDAPTRPSASACSSAPGPSRPMCAASHPPRPRRHPGRPPPRPRRARIPARIAAPAVTGN